MQGAVYLVGCRRQAQRNRLLGCQHRDVCSFQYVFVAGNQFSSRFIALDFSFSLNPCCVLILNRRIRSQFFVRRCAWSVSAHLAQCLVLRCLAVLTFFFPGFLICVDARFWCVMRDFSIWCAILVCDARYWYVMRDFGVWCAMLVCDAQFWYMMRDVGMWCAMLVCDARFWYIMRDVGIWCAILVYGARCWYVMRDVDVWCAIWIVFVTS